MIIHNCQQGTPEWKQARCGVITASMFKVARDKIGQLNEQQQKYVDAILSGKSDKAAQEIAGYKSAPRSETIAKAIAGEPIGDYSDAAKKYAFRLACERISGDLLDEQQFETWAMRRGHELEPEARLAHEKRKGILVEQTGFITTEDRLFGASVDGLINEDGSSEYKCFVSPASLMPILLEDDISDCIDQVQGALWITGRKWADFVLYCPALKNIDRDLTIITVQRDEKFIEELESDMLKFNDLVNQYEAKLRNK